MSNLGVLDMALDEVISQNRKSRPTRGRGGINKNRGRPSSSPIGARNARPARTPIRTTPRSNSNSLTVANLHFNVTEKDLYDLFGQIGPLRKAFLHIGPNGKSAGIADVVFVNANDAERAKTTYNNVELDGKLTMK
ncbi:hypothetical protein BDB01DRAFT_808306 [Pilobolus umbonatus]|nr:hypothetical protein BDB01DRAFT_808306 [Pilobolus umbonatus]